MKITLLGTGSLVSDKKRMGPGYLLEIGDTKILIDTGCGVQIRLIDLDIEIDDLDYIFITHFHPDHTVELYSMLVRRFLLGKFYKKEMSPLAVYGPNGMEKFIRDIAKIHQLEVVDSMPNMTIKEIEEKEILKDFTVEPFKVEHMNGDSIAFRFEIDEKVIVFSGDSIKCDGIEDAIHDADIFIADCSISKGADPGPHLNTVEIGEISKNNRVKKVVLSHLLPRNYDKDLVSEVKEGFNGEVILGEDLMEIGF